MTDPQIALMMLGLFIVFVFLGFPIAFTLMAMGIGFGYYAYFDASAACGAGTNRLEEDASTWDQWDLMVRRVIQQSNIRLVREPDLHGDVERSSDRRAAVPVHGIHRRARQYRRPPVLHVEHRIEECARLHGGCGPDHLCALRDGHRHRRRRRDADGPAGPARHA